MLFPLSRIVSCRNVFPVVPRLKRESSQPKEALQPEPESEKTELSNTFGFLAAVAVEAALGAGACYMIAENKEQQQERNS